MIPTFCLTMGVDVVGVGELMIQSSVMNTLKFMFVVGSPISAVFVKLGC